MVLGTTYQTRQFIGSAYSIIQAQPEMRYLQCKANPGDQFRIRFYTEATEVIARGLHATYVIRPFKNATEFRITLPEKT